MTIKSRKNFCDLLKANNATQAVEIGTHRGDFADDLLAGWDGHLTCVDPWSIPPGYEEQAKTLWGDAKTRDDDYQAARDISYKYPGRMSLLRGLSLEAVKIFANNTLDFVHIDGDHSYESVRADILAWYPKLKSGGILAGHDIVCPNEPLGWGRNVQGAIRMAMYCLLEPKQYEHCICHVIVEPQDLPWSYYIIKP